MLCLEFEGRMLPNVSQHWAGCALPCWLPRGRSHHPGWDFSRGWEVAARPDLGWGKGKTWFLSVSEGGLSGAFLVS